MAGWTEGGTAWETDFVARFDALPGPAPSGSRLGNHSGRTLWCGREGARGGRHGLALRAGEALPSDRVLHPIGWHGPEPGSIWVAKKGQSLTALDSHLGGARQRVVREKACDITAGLLSVEMRNLNFA